MAGKLTTGVSQQHVLTKKILKATYGKVSLICWPSDVVVFADEVQRLKKVPWTVVQFQLFCEEVKLFLPTVY